MILPSNLRKEVISLFVQGKKISIKRESLRYDILGETPKELVIYAESYENEHSYYLFPEKQVAGYELAVEKEVSPIS
jgi:hypothetical protein